MLNWLKNLFTGPELKGFAANGALIIDVRTKEEFKNVSVVESIPLEG